MANGIWSVAYGEWHMASVIWRCVWATWSLKTMSLPRKVRVRAHCARSYPSRHTPDPETSEQSERTTSSTPQGKEERMQMKRDARTTAWREEERDRGMEARLACFCSGKSFGAFGSWYSSAGRAHGGAKRGARIPRVLRKRYGEREKQNRSHDTMAALQAKRTSGGKNCKY
jgi:hypothetical protein